MDGDLGGDQIGIMIIIIVGVDVTESDRLSLAHRSQLGRYLTLY